MAGAAPCVPGNHSVPRCSRPGRRPNREDRSHRSVRATITWHRRRSGGDRTTSTPEHRRRAPPAGRGRDATRHLRYRSRPRPGGRPRSRGSPPAPPRYSPRDSRNHPGGRLPRPDPDRRRPMAGPGSLGRPGRPASIRDPRRPRSVGSRMAPHLGGRCTRRLTARRHAVPGRAAPNTLPAPRPVRARRRIPPRSVPHRRRSPSPSTGHPVTIRTRTPGRPSSDRRSRRPMPTTTSSDSSSRATAAMRPPA